MEKQVNLKISAPPANAQAPVANNTFQKWWALAFLGKDKAFTILPVDNRWFPTALNSTDYNAKMVNFLGDTNMGPQ